MWILGLIVIVILLYIWYREKYSGPRIYRGPFGPGNVIIGGIVADMTHTYGPPHAPESCQLCADCSFCSSCPQCKLDPV